MGPVARNIAWLKSSFAHGEIPFFSLQGNYYGAGVSVIVK